MDEALQQLLNEDKDFKFEKQDEPLRASGNTGLSGFISCLYRILKNVMPEVRFVPAWPQGSPQNEDLPGITYKVVSRVPAAGNKKPRFRDSFPDEEYPNQEVVICGQIFDVVMEFTIWADRAYEIDGIGCIKDPATCALALQATALCSENFKPDLCPYAIDGLMERFENLMFEYAGFFMDKAGVQQIYLLKQEDGAQNSNPQYIKRKLQYFLKIEKLFIYKTADLETISINYDVED